MFKRIIEAITRPYKMKCPYCGKLFSLAKKEIENAIEFTCPHCDKTNPGGYTNRKGIIIGITYEDFYKMPTNPFKFK